MTHLSPKGIYLLTLDPMAECDDRKPAAVALFADPVDRPLFEPLRQRDITPGADKLFSHRPHRSTPTPHPGVVGSADLTSGVCAEVRRVLDERADGSVKRSLARGFDWFFRNRRTGAITVVQIPNIPLWVFLGASALRSLLNPTGTADTVLTGVATVALLIWAVDELARGVNPWRRVLGAAVMISQLAGLVA